MTIDMHETPGCQCSCEHGQSAERPVRAMVAAKSCLRRRSWLCWVTLVVLGVHCGLSQSIGAQDISSVAQGDPAIVFQRPLQLEQEIEPEAATLVSVLQPQQRQLRYWTTNWSFRDINIGTLARRLARIGIAAPVDLDGNVTIEFAVSIPINALRDATAYRIRGTLQSPRLRVESTTLRLDTGVNYDNGIVSLTNLRGMLFGSGTAPGTSDAGQFQGSASLRLAGEGERLARIALQIQSVQLAVLTGAFAQGSNFAVNATGTATGSLNWVSPVDSITDATTWDADGQLALQNLSIDGRPALDLSTGPLKIADGRVAVPQLQINVVNVPQAGLNADFNADFRETRRWSAHVTSQRLPVESVAAVLALGAVPATQGELTLDVTAQGALSPLDWQVEGRLQSPQLTLYGVQLGELNHQLTTDENAFDLRPAVETSLQSTIRAIRADYAITPEAIDLSRINAQLFDGQLEGDFRWSRSPVLVHQANLDWSQLALRWDIGSVTSGVPGELLLRTQGKLAWQALPEAMERPAEHTLRAILTVEDLVLAGQSFGNAAIQVRAVEGELAVRGQGTLLGGTFEVNSTSEIPAGVDWSAWINGEQPPNAVPHPGEPDKEHRQDESLNAAGATAHVIAPTLINHAPVSGQLRLQGVSLARVGTLLRQVSGNATTGAGWTGNGDALVDFDLGSAGGSNTLGTRSRVVLSEFAINRVLISPALAVDLRTVGDQFFFDQVRGNYAGGSVELSGQWAMTTGSRQINVSFSRLNAPRALMPLTSSAADWVQGNLSGQLRLVGGDVMRITGSLEGNHARLFDFPFGAIRTGLTGVISDGAGGWQLRFPNIRSTVARGRIAGQAIVSSSFSGRSFDLRSSWTARSVDFEHLISGLSATRSIGQGNLSGSLTLDGRNIRGASDLTGRFEGTLAGTEASAVPGLSRARSYLGPIGGSSFTFTDGVVRGQIIRGLAIIDRLALRSERLRVAANGTIRLDNSRMNIDAVAATGDFSVQSLAWGVATRQLALAASPPLALLLNINRLINDRTVYLRIGGTPGAPVVNVRPVETVGQNALRYLLQEITLGGSTLAAGTVGDS